MATTTIIFKNLSLLLKNWMWKWKNVILFFKLSFMGYVLIFLNLFLIWLSNQILCKYLCSGQSSAFIEIVINLLSELVLYDKSCRNSCDESWSNTNESCSCERDSGWLVSLNKIIRCSFLKFVEIIFDSPNLCLQSLNLIAVIIDNMIFMSLMMFNIGLFSLHVFPCFHVSIFQAECKEAFLRSIRDGRVTTTIVWLKYLHNSVSIE